MSFVSRTCVTMTRSVGVRTLEMLRHHILEITFIQYKDKATSCGGRDPPTYHADTVFAAVTRRLVIVKEPATPRHVKPFYDNRLHLLKMIHARRRKM